MSFSDGTLCIFSFEELEELLIEYVDALYAGDAEAIKAVAQAFMRCGCYQCATNPLLKIDLDDIEEEMEKLKIK